MNHFNSKCTLQNKMVVMVKMNCTLSKAKYISVKIIIVHALKSKVANKPTLSSTAAPQVVSTMVPSVTPTLSSWQPMSSRRSKIRHVVNYRAAINEISLPWSALVPGDGYSAASLGAVITKFQSDTYIPNQNMAAHFNISSQFPLCRD